MSKIGRYRGIKYTVLPLCDVFPHFPSREPWVFETEGGAPTGNHYRTLAEFYADVDVRLTEEDSMTRQPPTSEIEQNHKADRAHYDTPGSVSYCACASCNAARRHHGKPARRWRWFGGVWDAVRTTS